MGQSWGLCGGLQPLSGPMSPVLGFLTGYVGGPGVLLGPLLAVLGRSWGLCSRPWVALGPLLAVPGRLGPTLWCYVGGLGSLLGPMLAVLAALGASIGGPGPSWAEKRRRTLLLYNVLLSRAGARSAASGCGLGPLLDSLLAVLGGSWGLCCRSLGALGPMLPVLGRSWDLCWRSWAALGAYVGGLGALGPSVVGPGKGSGRKSGPNQSGSRIRTRSGPHKPDKPPIGPHTQFVSCFFLFSGI